MGRVANYAVTSVAGMPDPHDLHVHAAALACEADIRLTSNVPDFPAGAAYEVMTPDEFFVLVENAAPVAVHAATGRQVAFWGPRHGEADIAGPPRSAGCEQFAQRVLAHLRAMALSGG